MDFIRNNQLNIMLVLSSVCLVIFVFLLMTNHLPKEKKKALLLFVFFTALLLITDRYAYIFRGQTTNIAFILAPFFKYLTFFNILNVVYGFDEFIKCMYKENHPKTKQPKIFTYIKLIIIIGHIFLIVSQFTNFYYSFDSNNIYHRESMYFLCYLFPLIATVLQYIVIAPEIKKASNHIFIPLVLYFTLPIIASIIQLFIPGLSLANIIIGGVVILLYSFTIYDSNKMFEEKKKNEADLKLANEIQQNEIPNSFPDRKDFELYAIMQPAKEVGGDFYDFFLIDDDHLGLVIADVSGKGVPAALNMFKAKVLLKGISSYANNPAHALKLLNDSFIDNNKLDMFVTIWFGIIELSTGKLEFSNAGHEDAIICNKKNFFEVFKTKHGLPIGAFKNSKYDNYKISLNKGDKLFLYTDGVLDAVNNQNRQYGIFNLLKLLNMNKNKNAKEIIKTVKSDLDAFSKNSSQFDDITMLCFELNKEKEEKNMNYKKIFKADINEVNNVFEFFKKNMKGIVEIGDVKKCFIVVDEVFSNIVKYGFNDNSNDNYISVELNIDLNKKNIKIIFEDNGIKFNPLESDDPDINLSVGDRNEGGLGIFIVKKMMDKVSYKYKDNKNILIMEKKY